MPPDFESIILTNLMQRLDEIQHEQSKMHGDIAVLLSEQANIKREFIEHKAQMPATVEKTGFSKIFDTIKPMITPIILAIFLAGRQSVEYSKPAYPPKAVISSQVDDTFVANRNRKLDSILMNRIIKP